MSVVAGSPDPTASQHRHGGDDLIETVQHLAGGLAHALNNHLAGIMGYADLIELLAKDGPLREYAVKINATVERAAQLLRHLLQYAGRGPFWPTSMAVDAVVTAAVMAARDRVPEGVDLALVPAGSLPLVRADAEQVRMVVDILIDNAIEAVAPTGGRVDVRMAGMLDGAGIIVTDDGPGIDPAIRHRLFEPFATTKDVGRNHGLGLAAVFGIMRRHGGRIDMLEPAEGGVGFQVVFPIASDEAIGTDCHHHDPVKAGKVLIIEDETSIAETLALLLQREGYETLVTHDGPAGLATFRRRAGEIGLVLLDLKLPGLGGEEILKEILILAPWMPCLLMTGDVDQAGSEALLATGARDVLCKPVGLARLRTAVRRVFAGGTDGQDASPG